MQEPDGAFSFLHIQMKCPHCHKEIDIQSITEEKKKDMLLEIGSSIHSISSLAKKMDMKRSTLRYHLQVLKSEGKIFEEKLENFPGQPVIIKLKENKQ